MRKCLNFNPFGHSVISVHYLKDNKIRTHSRIIKWFNKPHINTFHIIICGQSPWKNISGSGIQVKLKQTTRSLHSRASSYTPIEQDLKLSLTILTWSSIALWSVSCSQDPRITLSSTWHNDRNRDVLVFAGLSVSVNSATSSLNKAPKAPGKFLMF